MNQIREIASGESLGRSVHSSKSARRAERGNIQFSVFEKRGDRRLSVDRLSLMSHPEARSIATERGTRRGLNFYGWAVVTTNDAESSGRIVEATPTDENRAHADIVLPEQAIHNRGIAIWHAKQLAEAARWLRKGESCMDDLV